MTPMVGTEQMPATVLLFSAQGLASPRRTSLEECSRPQGFSLLF